jgi:putative PIN family toxin of toxin-antitoxin system
MTTAVLDTNVIVQSLFANPRSASRAVLDRYFEGQFRPQFSDATIGELLDVLLLPGIRALHQLSDDMVLDFVAALLVGSDQYQIGSAVSAEITHDMTDTKFLALAAESHADFLVTNDRRHLLPLKQFGDTLVVTPASFLRTLS